MGQSLETASLIGETDNVPVEVCREALHRLELGQILLESRRKIGPIDFYHDAFMWRDIAERVDESSAICIFYNQPIGSM